MAYNIYVVADSRGSRLQAFLEHLNTWPNFAYYVLVMRGKKVRVLWEAARSLLCSGRADFVYIYEGICNLTTPLYTRKGKQFWMAKRPRELICDLILSLNGIHNEAMSLNLYAKFTFLQELGRDLVRYNRIRRPTLWMVQQQMELDSWLPAYGNKRYQS